MSGGTRGGRGSKLLSRSLMHSAARLHYVERLPQIEVARIMQVSTATVSRLLARARDEGIVRIHVVDADEAGEVAGRIAALLGLRAVRVVESTRLGALAPEVGALMAAAGLPAGAVLVVGWGRTVQAVIRGGLPKLPGATVVPATGGMYETATHFQVNEFVRAVAEAVGGSPLFLHAPLIATPELRAGIASDPDSARVMELWSRADAAILGVGSFHPHAGGWTAGIPSPPERPVVGDVVRNVFDGVGGEVEWPGQAHLVAIGRRQLQRIPLGIGVAAGAEKAAAIIGAARSGMINTLVTDLDAAQAIVERLEATGTARG